MNLRPASPADRDGVIALIDAVYREYGDKIFLDGADADLLHIKSSYRDAGGEFIVLHDDGVVRGTHAVVPLAKQPGACTFRRLYLDAPLRGGDWGDALMRWAIEWATERGLTRVEFWSDTRFTRAHRFFARHGFVRDGRTRQMHDGAMPYCEYFFTREL